MTDEALDGKRDPLFRLLPSVALIATMVLAAGIAFECFAFASFSWCGVSGCSGGGFGVSRDAPLSFGLAIVAGVVLSAPIFGYPWTRLKSLRFGLASLVLVATSLGIILYLPTLGGVVTN